MARRSTNLDISGVLIVDKPQNITSFDVVRHVRQAADGARAGHTGTLDPLATGVLAICLGPATRIASLLLADDKCYRATARLGLTTDTLDITGSVLVDDRSGVNIEAGDLAEICKKFTGTIQQTPPKFSAVRINGRRAYALARAGETPKLQARPVTVKQLEVLNFDGENFTIRVACTKGTYIRSLVADIGAALGCGATLVALRREKSGGFSLTDSIALSSISTRTQSSWKEKLFSIDQALSHLPAVNVHERDARLLSQGQPVVLGPEVEACPTTRIRENERVIALGYVKDHLLYPKRVFVRR